MRGSHNTHAAKKALTCPAGILSQRERKEKNSDHTPSFGTLCVPLARLISFVSM